MKILVIVTVILLTLPLSCCNSSSSTESGHGARSPEPEPLQNQYPSTLAPSAQSLAPVMNDFKSYFTANDGQINSVEVCYYIQGQGVWFTPSGIVFELLEPSKIPSTPFDKFEMPIKEPLDLPLENEMRKRAVVTFDFLNSNNVKPIGIEELPHKSNFFYGNDSNKWCTDVPNYREIIYKNIYYKIDLRYYFNEHGLKYDFIIHPGGDPEDIVIKVEGAEKIILEPRAPNPEPRSTGDSTDLNTISITPATGLQPLASSMTIRTDVAEIVDSDLFVYQHINDNMIEVPASFALISSDCYGFKLLSDYDRSKILVIDPLIFSTFIGGINDETIEEMIFDIDKNIIVTGWTDSMNFPTQTESNDTIHNGYKDIFVIKLSNNGSNLMFSTFIGGKENDTAYDVSIDTYNNIFITGMTDSDNFPTTSDANDSSYNGGKDIGFNGDVFLCKLNQNGSLLLYSTFIGGLSQDIGYDLFVDLDNNIFITGGTRSIDFPITSNAYDSTNFLEGDAFVVKINNNCSTILYSSFFGGSGGGECAYSIGADRNGIIYLAGMTTSIDNFPTTPGAYDETHTGWGGDMFVSAFNSNLTSLLYSTIIGSNGEEQPENLYITEDNDIYIIGWMQKPGNESLKFPSTIDAFDDTFNGISNGIICRLNSNLSTLEYSSFFGGNYYEKIFDSIFDTNGILYLTGITFSNDFPTQYGVFDESYNGFEDIFVSKLDLNSKKLLFSSYIGTSENNSANAILVDNENLIYLGGKTSKGFPTTPNSIDTSYNGGISDAFILKLRPNTGPIIDNFTISDPEIYRSNSIELIANSHDIEDPEKDLTPHFEYMGPGQMIWKKNMFSSASYKNDRWQTQFLIPINATLGYYSFRICCNDTIGIRSRWVYLNESLLVLNNVPEIREINISKSIVFIDDNIWVRVNGTDVEDELAELTFEVEYKYSTDNYWIPLNLNNSMYDGSHYYFDLFITPFTEYGYYDFRVRVNDTDDDYSGWSYLNKSLLVYSQRPEILSIYLSKPEIYRIKTFEVYVDCFDPDSDRDELTVELQYKHISSNEWTDLPLDAINDRWETYKKSNEAWLLGNYSFRTRAIDFEDNICPWFYSNDSLLVLNNIPELKDIDDIPERLDRTNSFEIRINATDIENSENLLSIKLEYKLPGENNWIQDYLAELFYNDLDKSWYCKFTLPYNAPIGKYSFRARACDLDDAWSPYIYRNNSLQVFNSVPEVLKFDQIPKEVFRTDTVLITASGTDVETSIELTNCEISYQESKSDIWEPLSVEYDGEAKQWFTELVTTKSSVLGNYSFKVELVDGEGTHSTTIYAMETVWVRNNLPEISPELDDIQVGSTQRIFKLTDYGYDIETSKINLIWQLDFKSIDNNLFHIEEDTTNPLVLIIYPEEDEVGQDDITLTLIDADGSRAIKTNVTIIVDSRVEGSGTGTAPEKDVVSKLVGSNLFLFIILLIIIIIITLIFFILRRRKKQKEEEKQKAAEEVEETQLDAPAEALPPVDDTAAPSLEGAASEPVPALEKPEEPVPVPMPVPAEKPALPPVSEQPVVQPEDQPEVQPPSPETEPVPQPQEAKVQESHLTTVGPKTALEQRGEQMTESATGDEKEK